MEASIHAVSGFAKNSACVAGVGPERARWRADRDESASVPAMGTRLSSITFETAISAPNRRVANMDTAWRRSPGVAVGLETMVALVPMWMIFGFPQRSLSLLVRSAISEP